AGAWIGIIAFTFQIYFDFSGYSDMAIGLGRCFGFEFDENFHYPYISATITDFWRRWHISMGSFFRDYVYIPLGGNRRHQPLNIIIVWLLTGLWHGASWNFVIWGMYFGIILIIEKHTIVKAQEKIPSFLLHIYSMFIIIFGWVIFYFEDFSRLGGFIKIMFGAGSAPKWDIITQGEITGNLYLLIIAVICSLPIGEFIEDFYNRSMTKGGSALLTIGKSLCAVALLAVSTLLLIGDTNNPFLYFRF
ncbi:MAG: MBOAT family protein, partial [Oscillospiraceae bacterium]|nr:MBOAT family protein [Oscillospiraceae bacterium]